MTHVAFCVVYFMINPFLARLERLQLDIAAIDRRGAGHGDNVANRIRVTLKTRAPGALSHRLSRLRHLETMAH